MPLVSGDMYTYIHGVHVHVCTCMYYVYLHCMCICVCAKNATLMCVCVFSKKDTIAHLHVHVYFKMIVRINTPPFPHLPVCMYTAVLSAACVPSSDDSSQPQAKDSIGNYCYIHDCTYIHVYICMPSHLL